MGTHSLSLIFISYFCSKRELLILTRTTSKMSNEYPPSLIDTYFCFFVYNMNYVYSLEPPDRDSSIDYPQSMYSNRN